MTTRPWLIKVMLVDDHAVVRAGFRSLIDGASDMEVVAEAATGEEALQCQCLAQADVTVMDISMPGMGGLEATHRLVAKSASTRILILSAHEDAMLARRALTGGAAGYLTKRSAPGALLQAIRQVHAGKIVLEPELAQRLATEGLSRASEPLDALTEKEFKVFLALAKGQSVNEIADVMFLSPRTVGSHLYNIKQKLGAPNSAVLALIAVRAGLVTA